MDRVEMNRKIGVKVPSHLALTAVLSSSITIVVSLFYVVLSIIALIFRFRCPDDIDDNPVHGSDLFVNILFRVYFLRNECFYSPLVTGVLDKDTVYLLVIFTLIFSVLSLVAATALITVTKTENASKYISIVAYIFVGICISSLVIDISLATLFGIDYGYLTTRLDSTGVDVDYFLVMVRLGAAFLMTISLKGFVYPIVNITLSILLIVYAVEYQQLLQNNEHSIHKIGAIHAFEQQSNAAFIIDDDLSLLRAPRSPVRNPSMSDHSTRMYDRSESWQAGPAPGSRPFSYLGDSNRHMPVMPVRSPPVPEPDYSPPARRLKSALKPSYM